MIITSIFKRASLEYKAIIRLAYWRLFASKRMLITDLSAPILAVFKVIIYLG
ncbi:protein of unknown function [Moritella yayanosii]|uniref:Uncharacterized protein n=1 Tax=Moritella yayanosii TaxID=69539 RepID=A0A330LR82_9GAMM|nr:protein of unknown function [Moritella yayanosii]